MLRKQTLVLVLLTCWPLSIAWADPHDEVRPLPPTNLEFVPSMGPRVEQDPATSGDFWFDPDYWFPAAAWEGGVELGINASEGNSETLNLRAGGNLKRKTEQFIFGVDLSYAKATANSVETRHNALLDVGSEWLLGDSRWTLFGDFGAEYDEFKAFDLRLTLDGGVGYQFIKNDISTLTGRFGAGVSREIGGPDNRFVPEAVFGLEYERQLTERQKLAAKTEYFPAWTDFDDYRLVANIGWEVLLDEEANLSLKLGLTDRYDSTPHGLRPNDIDYFVLLIWKL